MRCLRWVKSGKAQTEYKTSALPLKADVRADIASRPFRARKRHRATLPPTSATSVVLFESCQRDVPESRSLRRRLRPQIAQVGEAVKVPRRQFLHLAAGAVALPAVSRIASAQTYPMRPVHLIVGFAAGGPTDIAARLVGQWLSERLGQQFVIENRSGAGSNIGDRGGRAGAPRRLYAPPGRHDERN